MRILFLILLLALKYATPAYSAQSDTPLTASVTVDTIFNMTLDTTNIDFGILEPGSSSAEVGVTVTCDTNANVPWRVSLHALSPFSSEQDEIPNSNFKWSAKSRGKVKGTLIPSGTMTLTPFDIYIADMSEYITRRSIVLLVSFSVDVPEGQTAGRYQTVVTVRMYPE